MLNTLEVKREDNISKIIIAKYKRVSTDNQELVLQNEVLDKYIERMKIDNPQIEYSILDFEDFDASGKNLDRKEFQRMLDFVKKRKINFIIFTKLDRLARSLQDLLNITSIFEANNVRFIAVEQDINTATYQGRLAFQIMGAFAEFERNITRERMESGRKRAELVGTKSGKPCHRPKITIDEDGVRFKYQQGMSMRAISKIYNVSITPIRRILSEKKETKKEDDKSINS